MTSRGAVEHAEQRWNLGFTLEDTTREYGVLRKVILQMLSAQAPGLSYQELIFLHEALDQAITESVATYVARSNSALESEKNRLLVTLSSIADGVVSADALGNITYVNPAAERIIGWSLAEVLGMPVSNVLKAVDEPTRTPLKSLTEMTVKTQQASVHPGEIALADRYGKLIPAEESAAPLHDADGEFMGVVTIFRDVSKVRELTLQLRYMASHDNLTGLSNRFMLMQRLEQELAHAERNHKRIALLYMDLDLFKEINDMFGHAAGDDLLKQVGARLQDCVRRTDTVCRVGGDEFIVVLTDFGDIETLSETGQKIIQHLKVPYYLGAERVDISTSVGISIYPEDGDTSQALIKQADIAMYQAKANGRNAVQFFAPDMNQHATEKRELQRDLRKAIREGQLSLNFQPQISLRTGQVVGAEALLRWQHPRLGLIPPSYFIP
ncbi:MAG: diguanylate cyclase, partial [Natronospirillum sp.]